MPISVTNLLVEKRPARIAGANLVITTAGLNGSLRKLLRRSAAGIQYVELPKEMVARCTRLPAGSTWGVSSPSG